MYLSSFVLQSLVVVLELVALLLLLRENMAAVWWWVVYFVIVCMVCMVGLGFRDAASCAQTRMSYVKKI
jgi:hypothetical protein